MYSVTDTDRVRSWILGSQSPKTNRIFLNLVFFQPPVGAKETRCSFLGFFSRKEALKGRLGCLRRAQHRQQQDFSFGRRYGLIGRNGSSFFVDTEVQGLKNLM